MTNLLNRLRNEPVLITALVQAALTLGVTFGLELPVGADVAILGFTAAVLAVFARSKVSPVEPIENYFDGHVTD